MRTNKYLFDITITLTNAAILLFYTNLITLYYFCLLNHIYIYFYKVYKTNNSYNYYTSFKTEPERSKIENKHKLYVPFGTLSLLTNSRVYLIIDSFFLFVEGVTIY